MWGADAPGASDEASCSVDGHVVLVHRDPAMPSPQAPSSRIWHSCSLRLVEPVPSPKAWSNSQLSFKCEGIAGTPVRKSTLQESRGYHIKRTTARTLLTAILVRCVQIWKAEFVRDVPIVAIVVMEVETMNGARQVIRR